MKHILSLFALLLVLTAAQAQAPQGIPYQAAARSSAGAMLASTPISVRFTIRDSIATGPIRYRETHSITTDANGMFSLIIGQGTPVSGTFSAINWSTNAKYQQVELDPTGGTSFIDLGTQQMMSVPYSIYSNNGLPVGIGGDIMYHNGTNWVKLPVGTNGQVLTISGGMPVWANTSTVAPTLTIGVSYGGGIVAYILQPGDPGYIPGQMKGLIAAPSDQSTGIQWGCSGTLVGGTSTSLGTGASNTSIVSSACGASSAARLCSDLVLGGYSDWYLPSRDELNKLYINRVAIGGFVSTGYYWSSSENVAVNAWTVIFNYGLNFNNKFDNYYVRAVRSFGCPETPNAITGTATVCAGSTTTLNTSTTGGTWSSSAAGVATVSSSGVVTGVSAGTATISYTVTESCGSATTTRVVTVNTSPSAGTITGTATVTAGSTTTLSNATGGGTWSSSNTGIATVGSTGLVTGVAAGTATITYSVTNTCGTAVATRVVTVSVPSTIGASYGGGKIAYILQPGDPGYIAGETHGIIAAPSDQSTGTYWGCTGVWATPSSTEIGTGSSNTSTIVYVCSTSGTLAAAQICIDLMLGGYSDWYLPSKNELQKLYINRTAIGGFSASSAYWSSSHNDLNSSWAISFTTGASDPYLKSSTPRVRAIRYF